MTNPKHLTYQYNYLTTANLKKDGSSRKGLGMEARGDAGCMPDHPEPPRGEAEV